MKSEIIKNVRFEDVWQRLSAEEKNLCCTHSSSADGWESCIAWNPVASYAGKDIEAFKKFVKEEQVKGNRVFGYLSYDLAYDLFNVTPHAKNDLELPQIFFYSFDTYVKCKKNEIEVVISDNKNKIDLELVADMSQEVYVEKYTKIKKYITEGDIYQINLTHRLQGTTKKNARQLFLDIVKKNNADHSAYIEGPDFEILSASPERFIKIAADRTIETFPIKGTRPRGKTPEEDERLKKELLDSPKEAAELHMITDLLRNDLGKISEIGSVKVVGSRMVRPYATVWHTYSHIVGKVLKHLASVDALLSIFPGGSITGCPKKRAMEIIDEIEPTMRGVYTGCIGYIDPDDSLDFNIAIRTLIKKEEKVYLQVGGGIVYDSNEKDEYQETFDKAKSFLGVL